MSNPLELFRRVVCPDRVDAGEALRAEYFPAVARGSEIITADGAVIATAADPTLAAEIAWRLNETERMRLEDQWTL